MTIRNFLNGVGAYPRAHRAIARHRLWPWMLIPGSLGLAYMALLSVAGFHVLPAWSSALHDALPSFLQWRGVEGAVTVLLWMGLAVTAVFTVQPLALALCSPVLALMSEITERRVYGTEAPPTTLGSLARDVIRTIRVNARILARMLLFLLLAWLLILVPLIGAPISALTIFLIQSYYNGFMLTDYTLERKRLSIAESVAFIRRHGPGPSAWARGISSCCSCRCWDGSWPRPTAPWPRPFRPWT